MRTLHAHKAQPLGSTTPEAVTIVIKDEVRDDVSDDRLALEARTIAAVLWEALPGATLDLLFAELLQQQASRLLVARRQAVAFTAAEAHAVRRIIHGLNPRVTDGRPSPQTVYDSLVLLAERVGKVLHIPVEEPQRTTLRQLVEDLYRTEPAEREADR